MLNLIVFQINDVGKLYWLDIFLYFRDVIFKMKILVNDFLLIVIEYVV